MKTVKLLGVSHVKLLPRMGQNPRMAFFDEL